MLGQTWLWYHISDGLNSHSKANSRVKDCPYTYILPKETYYSRCGMLIASFDFDIWLAGMGIVHRPKISSKRTNGPKWKPKAHAKHKTLGRKKTSREVTKNGTQVEKKQEMEPTKRWRVVSGKRELPHYIIDLLYVCAQIIFLYKVSELFAGRHWLRFFYQLFYLYKL